MKTKLIRISDHLIEIPEPQRKEDIINWDKKPGDCLWRRQEDIPQLFYDYNPATKINQSHTFYNSDNILVSLSEADTKLVHSFLERELHRRRFGVHIKLGDQIVWIHWDYYYNLQWNPMIGLPEKWGKFRWFQNDFCIVRSHMIKARDKAGNRLFAGQFTTKPKKTGISQIMSGCYLNESTMTKNVEFHMMSKSQDDVRDVCMNFYFYGLDNGLPYIMQPKIGKRNLTEIKFGNPTARISNSAKAQMDQFMLGKKKVLNTRVNAGPTKASGFDGPLVFRGWIDEYPKLWEGSKVSPDSVFKKTIETVKKQTLEIYGFLDYTSYVVEVDDRGFEEARNVWFNSELNTVSKDSGRTKSTMGTHFISVLDSMEGLYDPVKGKCDQQKVNHYINVELSAKTENSEKLRVKRQYPRTKEDAWGAGGISSSFDNVRLGELHTTLDVEVRTGIRPYKEGKWKWENEQWESGAIPRPSGQFCNVYFEALTSEDFLLQKEGRTKIFHDYHPDHINRVLAMDLRHEDDDLLYPPDDTPYVGSFDPTDYKLKRDVQEGSKNAGHTFCLPDVLLDTYFGHCASNIFYEEYFFRPDDPDEAYEDLVKSIIATGKRVLVEANKGWVITKLIKDGLRHFVLVRSTDGVIRPYIPGEESTLTYTTDVIIETYCRLWALYIKAPKAVGVPDYLKEYKSLKGLYQLMNFDPLNTKKFDLVVSGGLCLMARDAWSVYRDQHLANGGTYSKEVMEETVTGLLDF